jgi:integrase
MPRYNYPISNLISEEEALKIANAAKTEMARALISILWRFGARQAEILSLRREDIIYDLTQLRIKFPTLKRGSGTDFEIKERNLVLERGQGESLDPFLEYIIRWVEHIPAGAEVFPRNKDSWALHVTLQAAMEATGKPYTTYHFRHSCFNYLASEFGASREQLMYWKGAASPASVDSYSHAVPMAIGIRDGKKYIVHAASLPQRSGP